MREDGVVVMQPSSSIMDGNSDRVDGDVLVLVG